jgi:hypothetical protein
MWFLWTLTCAATPVLYAIARMAFEKNVSPQAPYWGLISLAALALGLAAALAPTLLQWRVLHRLAPGLKLADWALAMFLGWVMLGVLAGFLFGLWTVFPYQWLSQWLFQPLMEGYLFEMVVSPIRADGIVRFSEIVNLPWLLLLLVTSAKTALLTFAPGRLLERVLKRPAYLFWLAAVAGACAAAVFEQFYNLYLPRIDQENSLNGLPWLTRLSELGVRAGIGAVWGSASITAFVVLARRAATAPETFPRHSPRPLALLACTLAMALALPSLAYFFGAEGVRSGFPAVVKFFSKSPEKDQSSGESILSYAGDAQFSPSQYPGVSFSPDGHSFFALNTERELHLIDLASGADLGQIAEKLVPDEQFDHAWSPDASLLAVRTNGEEVIIGREKYIRHQNRYRLFELPQRRVLGEFSFQGGECFQAHGETMTFEKDGRSLWIRCGQYDNPALPANVMAIRLSVPSMNALEIRRYGERASDGTMNGMAHAPDGIISWQHTSGSDKSLHFRNLTLDKNLFSLRDLADPTQLGKLTLHNASVEEDRLMVSACGSSSDISNPAEQDRLPTAAWHSFCRKIVFDLRSGALISHTDKTSPYPSWNEAEVQDARHQLLVRTAWQKNSKSGETVVLDLRSGRERQRIAGPAQRALGISPDGLWLLTYARDKNTLRIYRVKSSPY